MPTPPKPTEQRPLPANTGQPGAGQRGGGQPDGWELSVWPVAQAPSRVQRRGRYLPEAIAHPAKMLPSLARHAITAYTQPGDLVLDPMCGIGTTLIEAVHAGRDAIGIEYEHRWADLAAAGITHAAALGAPGAAQVLYGDARTAAVSLHRSHAGAAQLLLTSPPYGDTVHGRVRPQPEAGVARWNRSYGDDKANLAHQPTAALLAGFTDILRSCRPLLRPGGVLAITARPWRRHGVLTDFPSAVMTAAVDAGYQPLQRCIALLTGLRDTTLIPRASFFQLHETRRGRSLGIPLQVVGHEDVLIFTAAQTSVRHRASPSGRPNLSRPRRGHSAGQPTASRPR